MDNVRELEAQAHIAQKTGDYETAIRLYNEILSAYPRWELGYTHYVLAGCYVHVGQIDLAIETYRQAIALDSNETMFTDGLNSLLEARKLGYV